MSDRELLRFLLEAAEAVHAAEAAAFVMQAVDQDPGGPPRSHAQLDCYMASEKLQDVSLYAQRLSSDYRRHAARYEKEAS